MDAAKPLLSVNSLNLSVESSSGMRQILKDINFDIPYGGMIGLAGSSGSGKSLTALSILQLLRGKHGFDSSGSFTFGKESVQLEKLSEQALQKIRGGRISIVFQDASSALNPVKKCGHQLEEMLRIHQNWTKDRIRQKSFELLDKVKLEDPTRIFNAYPHEISGGQAQRLMIAMGIANDPDLLIADEPTTGLDPHLRFALMDLIRDLQQQSDNAVLFISHDMELIRQYTDITMVMNAGQIIEKNATELLFKAPEEEYTQKLIDAHIRLKSRLRKYTGDTSSEVMLTADHLNIWYPVRKSVFNLKKEYIKAVSDVSFEIKKGHNLGIIGPSGSGKSTIAKCMTDIIKPVSGDVRYPRFNVEQGHKDYRKALACHRQIIFQDPYTALHPLMKVIDAVAEPMIVHKIQPDKKSAKESAAMLLSKMGIGEHLFSALPASLSGGERQRVCIARVLSLKPDLLILDEAVSKLDGIHCIEILDLLLQLQHDLGMSYIVITHDMRIIRYMCDEVIQLEDGRITYSGKVSEIDFGKNL